MRERMLVKLIILLVGISLAMIYSLDRGGAQQEQQETEIDRQITANVRQMVEQGRQIFRYDTFGDEAFWGETSSFIWRFKARRLAELVRG